jgi:hypothetical protein
MEYTVSEKLSMLWGISSRQIRKYCELGFIEGAIKEGKTWYIPIDAKRPKDGRIRSGKYFDWRIKYGNKME